MQVSERTSAITRGAQSGSFRTLLMRRRLSPQTLVDAPSMSHLLAKHHRIVYGVIVIGSNLGRGLSLYRSTYIHTDEIFMQVFPFLTCVHIIFWGADCVHAETHR